MSAQTLSGKELALRIRAETAARAKAFLASQGRSPKLGVVMAGDSPESRDYLRRKAAACAEAGIECAAKNLPLLASQTDCEEALLAFSNDPGVDAVLVELPLPQGLAWEPLAELLDPAKDVEGVSPAAMGRFYGAKTLAEARRAALWPCTAEALILLLEQSGVPVEGRQAVVVGRSNVVGKPAAQLLTCMNATVTLCHTKTQDLQAQVERADIVVCATTVPRWLKKVKAGAVVLDAGTHYVDGKAQGDADPAVGEAASWLTPVPGGVGPVTVAVLLRHVVEAAERRARAAL